MSLQGVTQQQQEQQNYQQALRFECAISMSHLRLDQPRIPFTDTHSHFHLILFAQLQSSSLSLWLTTRVKDMVNLSKHSLFFLCEQETKKVCKTLAHTHPHTQSLSVSCLEEKSARVPEPASIFSVLRPEIYFFCLAMQANNKASDFSGSPLHVSFCV